MDKFFKYALAAIALAGFSSAAHAETINKTVSAGKTSYIYDLALKNSQACRGGAFPKVRLTQPSHGKLISKRLKYIPPKGKPCAGNTFYYSVIYYTPNRGFRGKDVAKFSFSYPRYTNDTGHSGRRVIANITVK